MNNSIADWGYVYSFRNASRFENCSINFVILLKMCSKFVNKEYRDIKNVAAVRGPNSVNVDFSVLEDIVTAKNIPCMPHPSFIKHQNAVSQLLCDELNTEIVENGEKSSYSRN